MLKKIVMVGALMSLLIGGASQSAWAGCFTDFDDCMHEAANEDGFWRRWEMGLDCELDIIDCGGHKLNPFL